MLKRPPASLLVATGLLAASVTALLLWPLPSMPIPGEVGDYIVQDVAVVDVLAGTVRADQDIVLKRGKIIEIRPAGGPDDQNGLTVVDGRGKFLMPALWDMHTHSTQYASQYEHPLMIANGVTGAREMWGCLPEPDPFFACAADRRRWNAALRSQTGMSPRYIGHSGYHINNGTEVPDHFPAFFKARDAADITELFDFYEQAGVDFAKTYSELSPSQYALLAAEARRRGFALAGHRPFKVSLPALLEAGQQSVEHPRVFLLECFSGAEEFRALDDPYSAYDAEFRQRLVDAHDPELCTPFITALAESETAWVPTLQVLGTGVHAADPGFLNDPRLQYVPYLFRKLFWEPDAARKAARNTDHSGQNIDAAMYALALDHVGQAHAAGATILTGTDNFDPYIYPGFGVHAELEELVRAGLSPAAAIRSATLDAARFAGLEDAFGSVSVGKVADVLLLDANPLEDIRNTTQIRGLFFNGRYLDRAELDGLLEFARQRAGSTPTNLQILLAGLRSPLLRLQFAD